MTQEEMSKSHLPLHLVYDPEGKDEATLVKEEGDWKSQGYQKEVGEE